MQGQRNRFKKECLIRWGISIDRAPFLCRQSVNGTIFYRIDLNRDGKAKKRIFTIQVLQVKHKIRRVVESRIIPGILYRCVGIHR
jgi:hypothetical protein